MIGLLKRTRNLDESKMLGTEVLKVKGETFSINYYRGPRSHQGTPSIIAQSEHRGRPISINDCGYGIDHARILMRRLIYLTMDRQRPDI
jgi:hypothetical protein